MVDLRARAALPASIKIAAVITHVGLASSPLTQMVFNTPRWRVLSFELQKPTQALGDSMRRREFISLSATQRRSGLFEKCYDLMSRRDGSYPYTSGDIGPLAQPRIAWIAST